MRITVEMLRAAEACEPQVKIFAGEWPDGGNVTAAACLRAAELGLNLGWAAKHLLPAPAGQAYDESCATAGKAYDEACATAGKAYDDAYATARKAYDEARATAFFRAANM
jgi:hypothetical protein